MNDFSENGFTVFRNFYDANELGFLTTIAQRFHQQWLLDNKIWYQKKAVNSAELTLKGSLSEENRWALFDFISRDKLIDCVKKFVSSNAVFMNTQLFFDPFNKNQKNYWHRDPQYHLSESEQKEALKGPKVVHFRIPLFNEPGLEFIPGSHHQWDNEEELNVRLEKNGRKNHEDLPNGVAVPLQKGDLLAFDANMIHRGLYGHDRLALDILFCEPSPELVKFINCNCYPDQSKIHLLDNASVFKLTSTSL
ncbi:phytanoyl-CoA dioxygenase family protein [Reinekea marina]|uniref:Phytanoyl-CoA dioxygenase family protein n=2 Tax=Reinekea marina TaxID=1310421 RepID=A0ABV7WQ65_9GAMM